MLRGDIVHIRTLNNHTKKPSSSLSAICWVILLFLRIIQNFSTVPGWPLLNSSRMMPFLTLGIWYGELICWRAISPTRWWVMRWSIISSGLRYVVRNCLLLSNSFFCNSCIFSGANKEAYLCHKMYNCTQYTTCPLIIYHFLIHKKAIANEGCYGNSWFWLTKPVNCWPGWSMSTRSDPDLTWMQPGWLKLRHALRT